MGRKKQRLHLDRGEVLDALGKRPNISAMVDTSIIPSSTLCIGSYQRHFTHKLFVPLEDYLDAYILRNDICMLFTKQSFDANSLLYHVTVNEIMSGRRKKGARKIKADTIICEIVTKTGDIIALKTPVGGQLLEINETLSDNLHLLSNIQAGERYIAIIFPDTKIPSPGQSVEEWRAIQESMISRSNVCYSWIQGKCLRGEKCRFLHYDPSSKPFEEGMREEIEMNSEKEDNDINVDEL